MGKNTGSKKVSNMERGIPGESYSLYHIVYIVFAVDNGSTKNTGSKIFQT